MTTSDHPSASTSDHPSASGAPRASTPPLPDYHVHTVLCKHADGMPGDLRDSARLKGTPEVCITDHCPTPDSYDPQHRMDMNDFLRYRDAVQEVRGSDAPAVLFGVEADYYPGCERFLASWLPRQDFDLVLGSVHYIGDWGFDNPAEADGWNTTDVCAAWSAYFDLVGRLADTGLYDVVAHLDLPKKFEHRPNENEMKPMAERALDRIAGAGMGIEINTSGLYRRVREIYPSFQILRLAHERDIPVCFGSDAHEPSQIAAAFSAALELARSAGYAASLRFRKRKASLVPLPPM